MNNLTIVSNERVSINKNQEFKSTNLDLQVFARRVKFKLQCALHF